MRLLKLFALLKVLWRRLTWTKPVAPQDGDTKCPGWVKIIVKEKRKEDPISIVAKDGRWVFLFKKNYKVTVDPITSDVEIG